MTEQHEPQDEVTKVARDLTAIEDLAVHLATQSIALSNDRLMPGGKALVFTAPDADLDEWGEQVAYAELRHFASCFKSNHRECVVSGAEHVEDEDDQHAEDPLRSLLFWTDEWRREWSKPEPRPTLGTETTFIRSVLNWAWDNEMHFEDFARDVNQARRKLEDLLHAGRRAERSRVCCPDCDGSRLVKVYSWDRNDLAGRGDHWKCSRCKTRYDQGGYEEAYAKQLRSQGSRRFVPMRDAIALMKAQGRPERTVRAWIDDGKIEVDTRDGARWVWWPDLWSLHNATPTRQRSA